MPGSFTTNTPLDSYVGKYIKIAGSDCCWKVSRITNADEYLRKVVFESVNPPECVGDLDIYSEGMSVAESPDIISWEDDE